MYYLATESEGGDRMGFAVFLAVALHLLLVLGLTFESSAGKSYSKQMKVTLAARPSEQVPNEAQHIAQNDQVGSGEEAERERMSSIRPAQSNAQQATREQPQEIADQAQAREAAVVSTSADTLNERAKASAEEKARAARLSGITPEVARLEQQLASLEASLDDQNQAYADKTRVRRLTSVSAKRAVDAAYLHDWRARLEAVGNKYYPEASLRYGIYGELQLLVVIRQDGSLENLEVLSSSGYAVLDEAAMKIVRMAAPFAPFPAELRSTTDKLEIIRTWQFQENRLSSG